MQRYKYINMVWGKKKSLESCYKIQRKFYISEQLNKETEIKKYIWHKKNTINLYFLLSGGFCPEAYVLDPNQM
jgi:hypothetical protein